MASYALGDFPFKKLEACPTHNSTPSPIILKTRRFSFSLKSVKFWQYLLLCLKQKCASHYSREPTIENKKKFQIENDGQFLLWSEKDFKRYILGFGHATQLIEGHLKISWTVPLRAFLITIFNLFQHFIFLIVIFQFIVRIWTWFRIRIHNICIIIWIFNFIINLLRILAFLIYSFMFFQF